MGWDNCRPLPACVYHHIRKYIQNYSRLQWIYDNSRERIASTCEMYRSSFFIQLFKNIFFDWIKHNFISLCWTAASRMPTHWLFAGFTVSLFFGSCSCCFSCCTSDSLFQRFLIFSYKIKGSAICKNRIQRLFVNTINYVLTQSFSDWLPGRIVKYTWWK